MDQAVEQNRAQIADALERAEAQKNAKANLAGGAAALANQQRAREAEVFRTPDGALVRRAPPPIAWLAEQANLNLSRWPAKREGAPDIGGAARARAALDVLDAAAEQLGNRDRAGTAAWLHDQRSAVASALAAYEGFGADLSGPIAQTLVAKITAGRADRARAEQAIHVATRETIREARAEMDAVEADDRELGRTIAKAIEAMRFPVLPDLAMFARAKQKTEALAKLPGKKPSALQIHHALDEGRDATALEARLWICFEPAEAHALLDARWRRHAGQ